MLNSRFFLLVLVLILTARIGCAQQQVQLQTAHAGLKLPSIVSDHMVLQNGAPDPIWGWAAIGTNIHVDFLDRQGKVLASAQTVSDAGGKWFVQLPPLASGAAGTLQITAGAEPLVTVHDVLVGEAWLCGGQSNMTYPVKAFNMPPEWFAQAQDEAASTEGSIRFFTASYSSTDTPHDDVKGQWVIATRDTVGSCSAVAWNFAVALQEKLHRPIGLIISTLPGTPAEVWIPRAALDASAVGPEMEKHDQEVRIQILQRDQQYGIADAAWLQANPTVELQAQNIKNRPQKPSPPAILGGLYNGMIYGLEPYGIKGVIWFQADGNLGHSAQYGELIKTLITSWRRQWQEELPFYYVEMNNMRENPQTKPVQYNDLCLIREAQEAALELPGTDVACSIDLGLSEPHFPNKKPVGQRLALLALNNLYNYPCAAHSPQYTSFAVEGNKIRVQFKYADGLRLRGDGQMIGFAIRGATGNWVWAEGQIQDNAILLWNDQVSQPVAIRYAWAANPITSIENGAGLPLRPFRTDKISPQ